MYLPLLDNYITNEFKYYLIYLHIIILCCIYLHILCRDCNNLKQLYAIKNADVLDVLF